jgi:hypothetical protein
MRDYADSRISSSKPTSTSVCSILLLLCRWHIEGEITHDWKKLAERKEKQLRKLSDTYKGQLDKVMLSRNMQSLMLHMHACRIHLHFHLHLHAAFIFHAPLPVMCTFTALYYHGSIKHQLFRVMLCAIECLLM